MDLDSLRVRPLSTVGTEEERMLGGKAVQLAAALRAGLPVPNGVALPYPLVDAIAANRLDVLAEARRLLTETLSLEGGVAVRSSAIGEDGAQASFAGQHLSVLGLASPDTVFDAIRRVHASASAPSALAYRARMGVLGAVRVGVVVQRLVDAECAGVLFTRDPVTGADERIVEAAWGLGETVVSGLVVPDRFRLSRDGRVLESTPGLKDVAIRPRSPGDGGGTTETAVNEPLARAPCLDAGRVARLHALASQCEALFEGPHDLEWAFTARPRDELFLLQRRAITALGAPATQGKK
jgi:pyruvate,water dikinase